MQRKEFQQVVEKRLNLIQSVLASKGAEYSPDDNPFHNFDNATGLSFHKNRTKVAWEFMVKHLQSIKDMLDKDEKGLTNSEAHIEEKIGDAVNYLILIEGMLKDKK